MVGVRQRDRVRGAFARFDGNAYSDANVYVDFWVNANADTDRRRDVGADTDGAGAGAVELRWEAVPGAASYELRAWSSAGGWEQLDDGAHSATIFTHDGLTAGTTYYYWVRAVSEAGETGDWSDRKDATPSAPETPTPTPTAATTERGALVALHEATNGDNWTSNDNWLSDEPLSVPGSVSPRTKAVA